MLWKAVRAKSVGLQKGLLMKQLTEVPDGSDLFEIIWAVSQ